MTPSNMRIIGIVFMVVAALVMILNLKRVANLGTFWLGMPLLVIGLAFVARARKARL